MVRLRPAEASDWAALFAWRNDPETLAQFATGEPVKLKRHLEWLDETLANPRIRLYVATDQELGRTVGTIRLDVVDREGEDWAECSITVEPRFRGLGYASQMITAAIYLGIDLELSSGAIVGLIATVKAQNVASLRAFSACKFTVAKVTEKFVTLERPL